MKPARVLVVEDEPDLRAVVEYNLRLAGFETEAVDSAFAALRSVALRRPDLVVLDIMLPDLPGTQVCRELKEGEQTRGIPVLMLTAKGEEKDRVTGLEIGADDYVVKPVSMRELVLRVKAILRRQGERPGAAATAAATPSGQTLEAGPVRLDRDAHQAYLDGKPIELTPIEFRLLALLLERAGRAQSRETLLEEVWQVRGDIETRTVDTHVKRLREKLHASGDRLETVRGIGYRFRRDDHE